LAAFTQRVILFNVGLTLFGGGREEEMFYTGQKVREVAFHNHDPYDYTVTYSFILALSCVKLKLTLM
jgi:hypothetical protein